MADTENLIPLAAAKAQWLVDQEDAGTAVGDALAHDSALMLSRAVLQLLKYANEGAQALDTATAAIERLDAERDKLRDALQAARAEQLPAPWYWSDERTAEALKADGKERVRLALTGGNEQEIGRAPAAVKTAVRQRHIRLRQQLVDARR